MTTESLPPERIARLWTTLLVPRPIALVTTLGESGLVNIAPFSSFACLSIVPAYVGISFGAREPAPKNTFANIVRTGEFAVNLVPRSLATTMNEAARVVDTTDDYARLRLTQAEFDRSSSTRIAECPASYACRLVRTIDLSPAKVTLVIGEVIEFAARDEFCVDGAFDPLAAGLISSIGVEDFLALSGEAFAMPRTYE
ncbi:MAG: flavin reductase family protein [Capsulimonadaceae bacterium]|nr:flavin reductase family protein [Capsulimonadaceae bacterium]